MKNLPEKGTGKGSFAIRNWEEIRRGGGLSPSLEQIQELLTGGGDENVLMSREEVKHRILQYFRSKIEIVEDEDTGQPTTVWKSAPTKSELSLALDITPSTLARYCKGTYDRGERKYQGLTRERIAPEDFDLVRVAMDIITAYYESKLSENRNNSGTIFWLLNAQNERWSNEQTMNVEKTERIEIKPLSAQIADAGLVWSESAQDFIPAGGTKND